MTLRFAKTAYRVLVSANDENGSEVMNTGIVFLLGDKVKFQELHFMVLIYKIISESNKN